MAPHATTDKTVFPGMYEDEADFYIRALRSGYTLADAMVVWAFAKDFYANVATLVHPQED